MSQDEIANVTGPVKRWGHSSVEARGYMFIHGGYDGTYIGDVWCLNFDKMAYFKCTIRAAPHTSFKICNQIEE